MLEDSSRAVEFSKTQRFMLGEIEGSFCLFTDDYRHDFGSRFNTAFTLKFIDPQTYAISELKIYCTNKNRPYTTKRPWSCKSLGSHVRDAVGVQHKVHVYSSAPGGFTPVSIEKIWMKVSLQRNVVYQTGPLAQSTTTSTTK